MDLLQKSDKAIQLITAAKMWKCYKPKEYKVIKDVHQTWKWRRENKLGEYLSKLVITLGKRNNE